VGCQVWSSERKPSLGKGRSQSLQLGGEKRGWDWAEITRISFLGQEFLPPALGPFPLPTILSSASLSTTPSPGPSSPSLFLLHPINSLSTLISSLLSTFLEICYLHCLSLSSLISPSLHTHLTYLPLNLHSQVQIHISYSKVNQASSHTYLPALLPLKAPPKYPYFPPLTTS
jgi:hypothetical protein